ncbi:hypothetical protein MBSD_n0311 [Mizugakiibacter sediminis]|uniref:Tetratricopeptide repeat protein n=1 Tax=Mizugakiibacter sediminis TaxID=1475481 RepID=A0A0K8QJI9_9GAMM|nr:hypothetical protein [Mizugakiibacter sediminis]GAP65023.1 hypothetical protein MBSD_n0311 [Mizugakiibacter sediminis]
MRLSLSRTHPLFWLAIALLATTAAYLPALQGGYLFDDFPNIVDNAALQPKDASVASLVRAALSSPSSKLKRPLTSLTFAANYLVGGLDPFGMKLVNLGIHLLNGLLFFLLARQLLALAPAQAMDSPRRRDFLAVLIAAAWMVLPINLTAVAYVVQRMESLANLFVVGGLLVYLAGRRRMLAGARASGLTLCTGALVLGTGLGLLAKETAVLLPLYAFLVEWALLRWRGTQGRTDVALWGMYAALLFVPMVLGLIWLLPGLLQPGTWAARDFTLGERLLSEARIVVDYVRWTLLPTPHALSFYHDDYRVSTGLLSPWTTLPAVLGIVALVAFTVAMRKRAPLFALGLALFLGAQTLTATILPLELVYEHRNYFASFGLMLAVLPWLAGSEAPMPLARRTLLTGLLLLWGAQTALTAYAWGNPLRLAQDLALRAPDSPRAQYELGRTYVVLSNYDPDSPFTRLAYAPLERAMALPGSSILPEQALIMVNARLHRPIEPAWWDSMVAKLKAHPPGVQDESSLAALTQCARQLLCDLPRDRMLEAFLAALSHTRPSARLLSIYADYAWNVLEDRELGMKAAREAIAAAPSEPAYRITLVKMQLVVGDTEEAAEGIAKLHEMNVGGALDYALDPLDKSTRADPKK